jgi:tRNA uracil 4-sulfurtransferase
VNTILVRYAEMGLKGPPVRRRFQRALLDNIMSMLAQEGVEALVEAGEGRVYVRTDSMEKAVEVLTRTFGVASVSPAISCPSDREKIASVAADFSKDLMGPGDSFAIRARREGSHPFTSMDLAREVGSAVLDVNRDKGVRVDLTSPRVQILLEVRGPVTYIYSQIFNGPGGLPLGSQGKVVAIVEKERDLLSTWLMMKRGCRTALLTETPEIVVPLSRWSPELKVEPLESLERMISNWGALGVVYGYTYDEMEKIRRARPGVTAFFPLVGKSEQEIERELKVIWR